MYFVRSQKNALCPVAPNLNLTQEYHKALYVVLALTFPLKRSKIHDQHFINNPRMGIVTVPRLASSQKDTTDYINRVHIVGDKKDAKCNLCSAAKLTKDELTYLEMMPCRHCPRLNNNRFLYIWHHLINGLVLNDNANKYDVDNEEELIDSIYIQHKTIKLLFRV